MRLNLNSLMRTILNKESVSAPFRLISLILARNGVKLVGSCLIGVLIPLIDKEGVKVANIAKKWYFKWWVVVLFIKLILGTKKAPFQGLNSLIKANCYLILLWEVRPTARPSRLYCNIGNFNR